MVDSVYWGLAGRSGPVCGAEVVMVVGAGPGAVREIMVVLALACVGLLLAALAVFAPWYGASAEPRQPGVVEMRTPPAPLDDSTVLHPAGAS